MAFKETVRTAALANTALAALIGQQWFDTQLPQTAAIPPNGGLGAVVVQQITGSRMYSYQGLMATYFARFQFTVWGGQSAAGAGLRDSITDALVAFLNTTSFDGITLPAGNPNFVVGQHDALFAQTDGPIYQKVVDAMMYVNTNITGS
jgi:hypothetical protein